MSGSRYHFTLSARTLLAFVAIYGMLADPARGQFFAPNAIVEGQTISEWVADLHNWEIWLLSQGPDVDPFEVPLDQLDTIQNDGPIYFVAGFDTATFSRDVFVPPGRPLLQRLVSYDWARVPEEVDVNGVPVALSGNPAAAVRLADPIALQTAVAADLDSFGPFFFQFNGVPLSAQQLQSHRVQGFFTYDVPADNPFQISEGQWPMSVHDGFWFMHEPLAPGEQRTVRLGGLAPDGSMFPDITVRFTAVPEPAAWSLTIAGAMVFACWTRQRRRLRREI